MGKGKQRKRKSKGKGDDLWAEAKRRCRLNQDEVRMAKEMGLNPRKLIGNRPNPAEPWKGPVGEWLREMYERRQEKAARRKRARAGAEASPRPARQASRPARPPRPAPREVADLGEAPDADARADDPFAADDELSAAVDDPFVPDEDLFDPLDETERRVRQEAADDDRRNVERHRHFGEVAGWVSEALAEVPSVHRVVLFGSAALPLTREVPRWRKYRRLGLEIAYHCKDVDLAVWVDDPACLRALQRARNVTVNEYHRATGHGVAQHQVEVFVMEHGTDRYLGRLCIFKACPRPGKSECLVRSCGDPPHLRQHEEFTLRPEALAPERSMVLFEREASAEPEPS